MSEEASGFSLAKYTATCVPCTEFNQVTRSDLLKVVIGNLLSPKVVEVKEMLFVFSGVVAISICRLYHQSQ